MVAGVEHAQEKYMTTYTSIQSRDPNIVGINKNSVGMTTYTSVQNRIRA